MNITPYGLSRDFQKILQIANVNQTKLDPFFFFKMVGLNSICCSVGLTIDFGVFD